MAHASDAVTTRLMEGFDLYCRIAWQFAPPWRKNVYPRYADDRAAVDDRMGAFRSDRDGSGIGLGTVIAIANMFVPLQPWSLKGISDPEVAGNALALASFAACTLGGPASEGDLERFLCSRCAIETMDGLPLAPGVVLAGWRDGSLSTLADMLKDLAEHSRAEYEWLCHEQGMAPPIPVAHLNARTRRISLNGPILGTQHLLYSSLAYAADPAYATA